MKKTIFILLTLFTLAAIAAPVANAQDFSEVYRGYGRKDKVIRIHVPKVGIRVAGWFVDKEEQEARMFLKCTNSVRVMVVEDGYNDRLAKDARRWVSKHNLEELVSVYDEGDQVEIYVLERSGVIKQLLIHVESEDDQVVVHIKGNYPLEMIRSMMDEGGKLDTDFLKM